MNAFLLDTHVFIWYVSGDSTLNKRSQNLINSATVSNNLYLSAISLWEISMLEIKKRIILEMPCLEWINRALKETQVQLVSLSPKIAVETCNLPNNFHGDPADRIIVATARVEGLAVVTRDTHILQYGKNKLLSVIKA